MSASGEGGMQTGTKLHVDGRDTRNGDGREHGAAGDLIIEWEAQPPSARVSLRSLLVASDLSAVGLAWAVAILATGWWGIGTGRQVALAVVGTGVAMSLACLAGSRLYRARVCSIQAVEIQGLGRATALAGIGTYAVAHLAGVTVSPRALVGATALSFVSLVVTRTFYRAWLNQQRRMGRYARPVLLLGACDDAADLLQLTREHPELGLHVTKLMAAAEGPSAESDADEVEREVHRSGATGVIIAANAFGPDRLNVIARRLLNANVHVHLSSGLRGISVNRLRALPFAHEPLFYLEQAALSRWQLYTKRVLDVAMASIGLLLFLPLLVLAAAIKLSDGGPILFRQERVGRGGHLFTLYKLRTMVPGAEEKRIELVDQNERDDGPLFKLSADPRVTPLGRFLRASSLDEVPQFLNVLLGSMSLVGPRPALPHEVEEFDERLRTRDRVLPGITGLWQVEARDNPAFGAYRRLDLHYVENWSVGLDLSIVLATAGVVIGRSLRALFQLVRPPRPGGQTAAVLD